ncbi:MAG: hypothetical protein ACKOEC_22955 [Acidimicrobiia bacterium]
MDGLAAFSVGEGNWLPVAMSIAAVCASIACKHGRLAAMNLFVGVTLMVMGTGHVLAVTTRITQGTLGGSALLLYPIGIAILIPATLLAVHHRSHRAVTYNWWMAVVLIVLGIINIPLAIPALLNIAVSKAGKPRTQAILVGTWALVVVGLLAGGTLFMLSGARTFEEFTQTP